MTRVALLGLGRMGAPMAARLVGADHDVTVHNRTPRPERVPAGARTAATPAGAARGAEVVVTMVADAEALEAALAGPAGALAALEPGAVVVDMSTIGPDAARATAARCADAGGAFLDAPVSGSVPAAQSGALVAMVGGEADVLERVRPVLAAMTREQLLVGATGAGQAMKLAINLMLGATNQAVAELLAQAAGAGIAPERAYAVLAESALASPYVGYKRGAFLSPDDAPVAFSIALMAKDVALALEQARAGGAPAGQGEAAAVALAAAVAAGGGERDLSRVLG